MAYLLKRPRAVRRSANGLIVLAALVMTFQEFCTAFLTPNVPGPVHLGRRVKSKVILGVDQAEKYRRGKRLEEFQVGDEVEAQFVHASKFGSFCDIGADNNVILNGWKSYRLKKNQTFKAKIASIDLEKHRATIDGLRGKRLEEFQVGDEVEAQFVHASKFGIFCNIGAEKNVMLNGWKGYRPEKNQQFKAKIASIDLEKRRATIDGLDLQKYLTEA